MRLGITLTPEEEKTLTHYARVLQNILLNVPTEGKPGKERERTPRKIVYSKGARVSKFKEIITHGNVLNDNNALINPVSEEMTPFPTIDLTSRTGRKKRTKRTAFWSIKPNNISVVLHTKEPYIIKEEEPEVDTEPTRTARPFTRDILGKISDTQFQVKQAPLGSISKNDKEDIQASKDYLRRSIALAAAAEHKLTRMYESENLPLGHTGRGIDNLETVINMLYNYRSKLSEYFDIKYVPPELREKASAVFNMLRKILRVDQEESHGVVRKLINNNKKSSNALDTS
ncbi:sperm equatorial segment protein 1 [Rhynchocyon petersi]